MSDQAERIRRIRGDVARLRTQSWHGDYPLEDMEFLLELLGPPYHVLETTDDRWGLQHPIECRERFDELFECDVHKMMMETFEPPGPPGRWRIELVGGDLRLSPL